MLLARASIRTRIRGTLGQELLRRGTERRPEFHQVFVDAPRNARSLDTSPFIDANQVMRWLDERIGLVENEKAEAAAAMRSLAKEVNETIRQNIQRRPDLQKKYERVTGKDDRPDAWK